ncbi:MULTISPECIES: hypothetical protein [Nocardia]|uniref:hypothetical protein n=1 Tax=Nocardia TaxID=1817 RepID=UPI000FD9FAC9|nr:MULTISPECIES: hypothetical protein [Nocardia]MBF6189275.1 hypothetical protein [Nocardia farcinica]MBF6246362.1 hypothetical protein [Nocardia elegans]MBF6314904.1 hypothetical protein [Nocardia farcinica]MBF6411153.1 hypothetical protein [Nocardia farcinica]UEX26301.1 hypothetical protein LMJ57_30605 [Nocardia farcinica]
MKYEDTGSALEEYSNERDADGYWEPQLLEEPGRVHAFWRRPPALDFIQSWDGLSAVCRHPVRVLLPLPFDSNGADACPECARILAARAADPEGWEERRREHQRRRMREEDYEELKVRRVLQLRDENPDLTPEDFDHLSFEELFDLVHSSDPFDDDDLSDDVGPLGGAW